MQFQDRFVGLRIAIYAHFPGRGHGEESALLSGVATRYILAATQMASPHSRGSWIPRQGSEAEGRVTELPRALQTEVWEA